MTAFIEPTSIDEAEERRLSLVEKLHDINNQLSQRNGARDEAGNFLETGPAYWEWRKRAVAAKRYTEAELSRVKLWIKRQRRSAPIYTAAATGVNPHDPVSLLAALYALVDRLACEGVDLDPEEQTLKDAVREYLNQPAEKCA